jgi:lysophospholipase L1-like esterase
MTQVQGQGSVRTILCSGDSNTWGCVPLTAPEPPRRYEPWRRWPGGLRRELGDGYWIVEEGLLVCPAPVGRLELFAREVHRLLA